MILYAFDVFDTDKDGKISEKDLKKVMDSLGESLSDDEIKELFKMSDMDKDGYINFSEFSKMMNSV